MQGGYQGGYAGQPGQQQQGGYGGPPAMGQQQQQGGYGGPPMGQPPGGYGGPPSGQFQQNNSNNNQQMQGGGGGYPQQYGGGYQQQNQQGYPPQQNQQQGYPPQQQQGGYQQQQGGYQQQMPPQNQGGYPPQQQFNQQQSFPPQQQQYGAPPQQYGAPQQFGGGPMVPPSGAGGPYGSGPVVMQQGAGGMVAGAMQIYYPPSIIPVSMPGKPPRGRTIHPEWNVVHDAQRLRSAIKGVGTDNSTLIDIICNRDREHLQYVRLAYRDQFHEHLHKEIESDTSFFFRDTLMGLVMSDAEFRAYILRKATKGAGTRDSVLIDVICTARGSEALLLKAAYQGMYGGNLESVIKSECSGNYEKLLVALMRGTRPDWGIMQQTMSSDVNILYKATEGRLGTDERTVIETLVARSTDHLWALNQAYVQRSKKRRTFRQCLDSETSGNFKVALNAVMTDPCHWFAERIHKAAKGLGTNDTMLISNILLPNQWQLQEVVRILQQEYHKDLIQLIRKETSGHYRDALCAYVANCLRP